MLLYCPVSLFLPHCTPPPPTHRYGGQQYYGFDKLTLVPIATNLIEASLMSPQEEAWLDDYHSAVYQAVAPRVSGEVLEWLKANTAPLKEQLARHKA